METSEMVCSRCLQPLAQVGDVSHAAIIGMPNAEAYLREGETVVCIVCIRKASQEGIGPEPGYLVQRLA